VRRRESSERESVMTARGEQVTTTTAQDRDPGMRSARPRVASALAAALAALSTAALTACGGSDPGPAPVLADLNGTHATCTIADGATSCAATVVWHTSGASAVQLTIDGAVASTLATGTLAPIVVYGTPIVVQLQADAATAGPQTITAGCGATSHWDGETCSAGNGTFVVSSFSVADGATGVSATTAMTGTATEAIVTGTASITCHDADDATVTLPTTVAIAETGTAFSIQPTYATYAMLPHHAQCTLTASVYNGSLVAAPLGPLNFVTDSGAALHKVFVRAGANGLPFLVDPVSGATATPTAMAAHLANCTGVYDRHLARLRTLCGQTFGGLGAVWDIDPSTNVATPVNDLTNVFANGNISEPDVQIDHAGTEYMTRGGLQGDGTSNSMVVVVTPTGHSTVSWDWAGRQDYIQRLVLDEAGGKLYAVSRLGLITVIDTATLAVTGTAVDVATTVNDAVLLNGRIVLSVRVVAATGVNFFVYDTATQALLTGIPNVGSGRGTSTAALSAGDLVVSTTDAAQNTETGSLCRLDPATFQPRAGTPCTATGAKSPNAMASDGVTLFGDLASVLSTWPVADFSAATPLATFDGPVVRVSVVQN
jgi:hypothetical protein